MMVHDMFTKKFFKVIKGHLHSYISIMKDRFLDYAVSLKMPLPCLPLFVMHACIFYVIYNGLILALRQYRNLFDFPRLLLFSKIMHIFTMSAAICKPLGNLYECTE